MVPWNAGATGGGGGARVGMARRWAGTIEDFGAAVLQLDFANAYMGGGVLGRASPRTVRVSWPARVACKGLRPSNRACTWRPTWGRLLGETSAGDKRDILADIEPHAIQLQDPLIREKGTQ